MSEAVTTKARRATRMPDKGLTELQRQLKQGYRFERSDAGHYRVRDQRHGRFVELEGRPIQFSGNPSAGVLKAIRAQLTEARVLKGTEQRVSKKAKQAQLAASRAAVAERSRQRQQEANALRARFAEVFASMGGIKVAGLTQDIGQVAALLLRGEQRNGSSSGMTPDLLSQNARRVLEGGWVEPRYQEVWALLLDHLESATSTGGEWFNLVREARGLPRDVVEVRLPKDAQDDWPFRVELLPLEALLADPVYQRPPSWPFVRREAARFDPSLVGTIDVAQRSPSQFAILDGQQRVEIVRLVGKKTIWASIYVGLDLASEARFFLHKNRDRKNVHPFYVFRARVASQDATAVAIDELVRRYGYKIAIGAPREDRVANISAISGLLKAYERQTPDGRPALEPTLATLKASTFGRPHGQDTLLIRGVAACYAERELDQALMVELITEIGPQLILGRAHDSRMGGRSTEQAVRDVLMGEYDRRERKRRRTT